MENILPPANSKANMRDYVEACQSFDWREAEKTFTWHRTGKVNMAYEAIDRHAEDPVLGQRCCLNFEGESRNERITYAEMKDLSNRFANVLRKLGVKKGDRVLIFLPRCPEYYIAMVGCAKVGAIFCPLFEALMQVALRERIVDSGAKILVTSPRLEIRIPLDNLPEVQHAILVGAGTRHLTAKE